MAESKILNQNSKIANGSGLVFDPDPLTTAGVDYGGAYVDADDADVQALNDQRIEVVLNDITQGTDGLYRLEGPYAIVTGSSDIGGSSFQVPAEANPNAFRYTRNDDRFEAVMAYYHIDKSQRYVQSLNLGFDVQAGPLRINPHGLGNADDSRYYTGTNAIALGDGGIDDAEDADVIWHEYGHALLQGSAPGLLNSAEGQALHEGWADYWAASYSRGLIDAGLVPDRDWRKVFTWDGNDSWNGRFLNSTATYPDGLVGNKYIDGDIWATTLMEVYTEVGREVTDALNLLSHTYLNASATFADAGMALVQADIDHFDAAHAGVLVDILGARGYVDPTAFGPALEHDPIPFVEQTGGSIEIEVEAVSVAQPVSRVVFVYSVNGGTFSELNLTAQGNNQYTGSLTLPAQAAEIVYYIEAFDQAGQRTRLPANAPQQTFRFEIGPDIEAPAILHQAIGQVAIQAWPPLVIAEVSDNQGVDSVWVNYTLEGPGGTTVTQGSFGLIRSQDQFTGSFPLSADLLEEGSRVLYRIHARDVADAANENTLPSIGMLQIEITVEGVLATYTFENNEGLAATGAWARGEPSYGLRVPHAGQNVWSTGLAGPYPEQPSHATLTLPVLNLASVEAAHLSFWHWYDFEHSGQVFPDQATTEPFWDGGNIKVSSDGGASWTVLEPQGGYNGRIEASAGNPLGGEAGFGGYSFGWRRVRADLPRVNNLMIRFDFGTDNSNELNAQFYGGWALDDVRVTTFLTPDATAPTLVTPPPARVAANTGEPPPPITVQATDNVGLEAVLAEYTVVRSEGANTNGTLRLAMAPTDLSTFSGTFPAFGGLTAGDRIEYRIRLRDFDGNSTIVPAAGTDPYRIDYRVSQTMNVLAGVRPTGLWQAQGTGWIAQGEATQDRSSLVLQPSDLPVNTDEIHLTLAHSYRLGDGLGGNVQVSTNSGASWSPLMPVGGYNATFSSAGHPMDSQPIFFGESNGAQETVFDLTAYGGQQIRLRIDFGAARNPAADEFWSIVSADLTYITFTDLEDGFDIPRTLALHPNFPDPFTDDTVLSYTLPEQMPVHLALYNMLGQRIALLVDGTQEAGTHTFTLRRGNLASGVYLLRMIAGEAQHVERMVITR